MVDSDYDDAYHLAGDRLGKFVILDELGRGSMGVVYEAFQEDLKRKVAIKILPANIALDAKQVRRFRREAESMARLQHEHIIPIYEVGEIDATHYFAMEKVEGQALGDRSFRDKDSMREAARLAMQAARGLAHAHDQGVIHRDVKPGNLLVARDGRVVVSDFGLARLTDSVSLTSTDAIVGTPKYMAPEQILPGRDPLDGRADIYSLGATLYEVVAGRPPFEEPSVQAFIKAILEDRPVSPRKFNRQVPIDLATIILRCLEKNPNDRYERAADLADDLDRFLKGERIHAKPKGAIAIGFETIRRHRVVASLAAIVVVALIASLFLGGQARDAQLKSQIAKRVTQIQAMDDAAAAVAAIEKLAEEHPGQGAIEDARKPLYRRHAEKLLELSELTRNDWNEVLDALAKADATTGFWYPTALLEVREFDAAQDVASGLPPGDYVGNLIRARLALARGDTERARDLLATPPKDDVSVAQRVFHHLIRGDASLAMSDRADTAEQRDAYLKVAEKDIDSARRAANDVPEPWLRTRVQLRWYDIRSRLGASIGDWTSIVIDGARALRELGNLLTNWWGRMSPAESRIAREYLDAILELSGLARQPPASLEIAAQGLVDKATTDRDRVIAYLTLAIAKLSRGRARLAEEALLNAGDHLFGAGNDALFAYYYWGHALTRRAEDDVAGAIDWSINAFKQATRLKQFTPMSSLTEFATILGKEARKRNLTAQADAVQRTMDEVLRTPLEDPIKKAINKVLSGPGGN